MYTPQPETLLSKKLAGIRQSVRRTNNNSQRTFRDPKPSPMSWVQDGVDHINIWEHGETELGKVLAHNTVIPFNHHIFGNFSCIEAFWHYISSQEHDDRIRTMRGRALHTFSRKLSKLHVPNFCAIILDANWQKIKRYPEIQEALIESTLPIDCYYTQRKSAGIRIRVPYASWLIDGFEEIRKALKEGREPDFSRFCDPHEKVETMYEKLLDIITNAQAKNTIRTEVKPQSKISALLSSKHLQTSEAEDLKEDLEAAEEVIETLIPADMESEGSAVDAGRGLTSPVFHIDEFSHLVTEA